MREKVIFSGLGTAYIKNHVFKKVTTLNVHHLHF